MSGLSTGTVTLLFTDIEGSTRHLQSLREQYTTLLADHRRLLREAFAEHGGTEIETSGDSTYFTFPSARAAILAAISAQRAVIGHTWPDGAEVRVRMGVHTGEPVSGELGYVGIDVHRAARISAAGHGAQILLSQTTRDLAADDLPAGVTLVDLGQHRLKDLASPERIFQVATADLPRDFPSIRSIDVRPNNLPRQLTGFVGRHDVVGQTKRILATSPLLTLTGPGGVGKTRLAIELASDLLDEFDDGVWFVELGSLTDPVFVLQSVASVLGVAEQPGRPLLDTTIDFLRSRRVLLVLDNCEHVLVEVASAADALLRGCPALRVVATSREGLGIPGEALFPVPSLSLPARGRELTAEQLIGYEAVRLFVERAMAASPSFRVTEQNAAAVGQICQRLDGVPLAIELAAARVRALSVDQIAARLDDRFRLLTGSSRLTVPRHQTLRATIDWSYDLLAGEEQAIFRRLSVFAGGCTLEAAEAICAGDPVVEGDVLDQISRLVDKSLVVAEPEGEGRYRLLETVRQYARDRLLESGEATEWQRRHRDWYQALVEQAAPQFFRGPESVSWLERLEREHDDLRAALLWSEDEPGERHNGLRLATGLWRFWEIRGHLTEGRAWLERMLAATNDEVSARRANGLTGAGVLASMQGDHNAAAAFHEEALAINRRLGDPQSIAYASNNLANTAMSLGDYERARQLYANSLDIAHEMGNDHAAAFALINMADAVARLGEYDRARSQFEESLAMFRRLGDRWGEALALDNFALVASRQRDLRTAESLHDQALAISRDVGDQRGVARALTHLADIAIEAGDAGRARNLYRQSLTIRQSLGDVPGIAAALEKLAWVVMADDAEATARLLGCAEALRAAIRVAVPATGGDPDALLRTLEAGLDQGRLEAARREGRAMTPDEALATLPP